MLSLERCVMEGELLLFMVLEGGWSCSSVEGTFYNTRRKIYGLEIALLDNAALNLLFA